MHMQQGALPDAALVVINVDEVLADHIQLL